MTSQVQTILKHLQTQGSITQAEAGLIYKIRALPRRISDLKAEGYKVVSRLKTDATGQRYARYVLLKTPEVGDRIEVVKPEGTTRYSKGDQGTVVKVSKYEVNSQFGDDLQVDFDKGHYNAYVWGCEVEVIANV